jgi:lipopolysaccharide export system permease protein
MTIYGVPLGAERFKTLLFDVATANLKVSLKERTFNDNFKQIMLYVNKIDAKSGELRNVLIEDSRTAGGYNTVIARSGRLFSEPKEMVYYLRLYDGTISQVNMRDRSSHTISFETYDIRLDLKAALAQRGTSDKRPNEMRLSTLRAYLERVKAEKTQYLSALLKYHKKFSIPVACLAMGLLAVPLGIQARNAKKAFGIGLGLLFFLLYYILLSVGTAFGETGSYPPVIGMWMPNVILGGFGIYLLLLSAKEKPLAFDGLAQIFVRILKKVPKK